MAFRHVTALQKKSFLLLLLLLNLQPTDPETDTLTTQPPRLKQRGEFLYFTGFRMAMPIGTGPAES